MIGVIKNICTWNRSLNAMPDQQGTFSNPVNGESDQDIEDDNDNMMI